MKFLHDIKLPRDPTNDVDASTKKYVDNQVGTRQANLGYTPVNKAGDTMTGNLSLPRIVLSASKSANPGVVIKGERPTLRFDTNKIAGGYAFDIMDAIVNNDYGNTKVGKVGVYGTATGVVAPSGYYMYFVAKADGDYNNATLKIDSNNRVGIGLTSTNRPSETLEVNGKIKMNTQTAPTDSNDTVSTKGYVDSLVGGLITLGKVSPSSGWWFEEV